MIPTAWNTYEVRWFLEEPHTGLRRFFNRLAQEQFSVEERVDDYLATQREDIGIKLREGRLEVKTRSDVPGRIRIGTVSGILEVWSKRGFTPEEGAIEAQQHGWISVRKKRRATIFCPGFAGPQYYALSESTPKGIQIEYTELRIGSAHWYSIGLEWPARSGITLLDLPLSDEWTQLDIDPVCCMGYPKFLLGL